LKNISLQTTNIPDDDHAVIARIQTKDIVYFAEAGRNSTFCTPSDVYKLKNTSLRSIKSMLPGYFVQCHKSLIVNKYYIEAVQKGLFGWEIKLKGFDLILPSGEKYKENVTCLQA
jgi:DNA-binding LytR/AlgR family response regulator